MSDDDPKLTAEQMKRMLADARAQEIADETAAMTKDERDAFLAKAGVTEADKEASRVRQRKMFEEAMAKKAKAAPPAPPRGAEVIDLSTRRGRLFRWAANSAGSIAIAAAVAGLYMRSADLHVTHTPTGVPTAATPPGTIDTSDPMWMRYEGMSYCAFDDYKECLVWLDRARVVDPGGEEAWPRVLIVRAKAEKALASQPK